MISEVKLNSFGRFRDRKFHLGATTVFFGANESGKTTVFDAVLMGLCRPHRTSKQGKQLHKRYGQDPDFALLPLNENSKAEMSIHDFLGVHAIRSGELTFGESWSGDRKWVSDLKARILTGSIDVGAVVDELQKRGSDTATYKHNRGLAALKKELHETEQKLTRKRDQREAILSADSRLGRLDEELIQLEKKLLEQTEHVNELAEQIQWERKIRKRQKLERDLRDINEREKLKKRLEVLALFKKDHSRELDQLETQARIKREKLNQLKAKLEIARDRQKKVAEIVSDLGAREPQAKALKDRAEEVRSRLIDSKNRTVDRTVWRWGYLGAAAASLVAGVGLSASLDAPLAYVALFLGFAASFGLALAARRTVREVDAAAAERACREELEKWNLYAPEESKARVTTLNAFIEFCDKTINDYKMLLQAQQAHRNEERSITSDISSFQQDLDSARKASDDAVNQIKVWLSHYGVKDKGDYTIKVTQYAETARALGDTEVSLDQLSMQREEIERQLRGFDEEGVPNEGLADDALQRLENQHKEKKSLCEELREQYAKKRSENDLSTGQVQGELKGIPEAIALLESDERRLQLEIQQGEQTKEAARIAASLFMEIDEESDLMMAQIAKGTKEYLRIVLLATTEVEATDLKEGEISVTDATGTMRSMNQLSRGTRDAVVLAARLALAECCNGSQSLLILDEPFLTLDEDREKKALEMLLKFQRKNQWQLVFLTKERRLLNQVKKVFEDAVINYLDNNTSSPLSESKMEVQEYHSGEKQPV